MHEEPGGHRHPPTSAGEAAPVIELPPDVTGGAGLLTPADIRRKVFTTVRLREGYDLAQVDVFLDQVEGTLSSVLRENAALKARLDSPRQAGDSAAHIVGLAHEAANRAVALAQEEARAIVADARAQAETARHEALGYATRMREGLDDQLRRLRDLLDELREQDGARH
ncbi:DivIVA domain-containing protein [Actinomadura alba]|uniref:Cell wall synthesis protein Wag31 n=1 Tax=Actinomadura alba TaxID=406431 RepID=A0ABR7M1K1_9ACTN|nr:DivIVA domain-containing protein [Actinomadura alba]MBC6470895.1 DivIVA domain-containing protein [Actinomadura alba]